MVEINLGESTGPIRLNNMNESITVLQITIQVLMTLIRKESPKNSPTYSKESSSFFEPI